MERRRGGEAKRRRGGEAKRRRGGEAERRRGEEAERRKSVRRLGRTALGYQKFQHLRPLSRLRERG
ncbi:MAG: hypothetical protein EI684_13485 [Candidatus Viridilinea halotolerans]|uniref:Uncharacterized protein n=1 Tax=Candidatus Viridilinea halotolerans TaxID=2491704 RepID=A0A426TXG1_9CHLR|nr:MAG: hypothetical protein EI684_13485 [Candidatus Viridilinea halotolerans]